MFYFLVGLIAYQKDVHIYMYLTKQNSEFMHWNMIRVIFQRERERERREGEDCLCLLTQENNEW